MDGLSAIFSGIPFVSTTPGLWGAIKLAAQKEQLQLPAPASTAAVVGETSEMSGAQMGFLVGTVGTGLAILIPGMAIGGYIASKAAKKHKILGAIAGALGGWNVLGAHLGYKWIKDNPTFGAVLGFGVMGSVVGLISQVAMFGGGAAGAAIGKEAA